MTFVNMPVKNTCAKLFGRHYIMRKRHDRLFRDSPKRQCLMFFKKMTESLDKTFFREDSCKETLGTMFSTKMFAKTNNIFGHQVELWTLKGATCCPSAWFQLLPRLSNNQLPNIVGIFRAGPKKFNRGAQDGTSIWNETWPGLQTLKLNGGTTIVT